MQKRDNTNPNRRTAETEQSVLNFYEREDISRQAPGKRDVLKVKVNGSKVEKQKRHLSMSIIEAYNLWKEENKSAKLGKSTFASLRPQHVLPASKLPKNVCVCRYHENFILLLEALHKHDSAYPAYHHSLPACTVCEESSDNCWFNKCENCQNGTLFKAKYPVPNDLQTDSDTCNSESDQDPSYKYIKWMQWEKIEGMDGKDRQEKVRKCGLPSEVYHC